MVKYIYSPLLILFVMLIDQISKWWITECFFQKTNETFLHWMLTFNQDRLDWMSDPINSFFNITMVWNTGISFGLFRSNEQIGVYVLSGLSLIISLFFLVWIFKTPHRMIRFAGIMVIAGALGNVWDRLRFGGVIDFLDFHIGKYHYPAFNIADSCIVIGVGLILIHGLWIEPKGTKNKAEHE